MSDRYTPRPYVTLAHPEWTRAATLYELNTRAFTPEGTLAAAEAHLPRLKDLGVDIVWLMPVHPIGVAGRKGTLGSPYAVRDYTAVNPELGTFTDLQRFVQSAHGLGMRVILDWVANHTAPDHPWTAEHPEWYARDWKGDLRPTPWWDWTDVVDLDYAQPALRRTMTEAMAFWVREADVDGFRCDVAGFVPVDFWETAREVLDAIKPVFLLAEWESRDLHARAFDATYAWSWYDAAGQLARGEAGPDVLAVYYSWNESAYPREAMRMTFTSNHDKNAWEGTMQEHFGDGLHAAIVLSIVGEGMPLLYSGQEAGSARRLAFFEKDEIAWQEHPTGDLFRHLFALKHATPALWNAPWGARMVRLGTDAPETTLAFVRVLTTGEHTGSAVVAVFNWSAEARTVTLGDGPHAGTYTDAFSGETATLAPDSSVEVAAWGWRVLAR
ncbi:MAG TPA: alpha-amylase family glycosyl hydrolase [Rubricoccaceae bacterium]|jgi:hypothetical protein